LNQGEKKSISSNRSIGYKNIVPNLNLIKPAPSKNFIQNNPVKFGPQSQREIGSKTNIHAGTKSKPKLNDSRSLNNSVSEGVKEQNRSKSQNTANNKFKNDKVSASKPNLKMNSYASKSPNNRNPFSGIRKTNPVMEKTPRESKRSPSPVPLPSYVKNFSHNKIPNFSKLTGNLLLGNNDKKKFPNEHMDVQVINNTYLKQKPQIRPYEVPTRPNKNIPEQKTVEAGKDDNPTLDDVKKINNSHNNLIKKAELEKMTQSPIVIKKPVNNAKNPPQNNQSTPNIITVNKDLVNNSNSTQETENKTIIKTVKCIHDITKTGYAGPGQKKTNQDNFFIYKNFNNNPNSIYFGVCDGHGVLGHDVSAYLRETLPASLDNELKKRLKNTNMNKIIEDTFVSTNYKLNNETQIDTNFSGSTCVTVIYTPEKLLCANVGDSRAVLGRCVNGCWVAQDLSRDHKPSDKDESERIIKRRGRIEPFRDEEGEFIGPARVWLKEDDIPGLAMSRSYGDQVAASVGVIAEPEIKEWKFSKDDMFFVIASDGVWEFIESEECVNMIKPFYLNNDIQGASEFLVNESTKRWRKEEEVIDDITLVLVFLN